MARVIGPRNNGYIAFCTLFVKKKTNIAKNSTDIRLDLI